MRLLLVAFTAGFILPLYQLKFVRRMLGGEWEQIKDVDDNDRVSYQWWPIS